MTEDELDGMDLDRVVRLALEMVERVRDVGPGHNWAWWASLTEAERWAVSWTLATMVDPSASTSRLLSWTWVFAREVP